MCVCRFMCLCELGLPISGHQDRRSLRDMDAGNCDARDAKIKRVASDQRLKDMAMASSTSLASSDDLPSSFPMASSASRLSHAAAAEPGDSEVRTVNVHSLTAFLMCQTLVQNRTKARA